MGSPSTSKWPPSNGTPGKYDNFHCGIFLGLDSSLAGMRLPARYARAISIENQDLSPARSTWRIVSVTAHEIGKKHHSIWVPDLSRFSGRLEKELS
ncbi:uncharacterized protein N7477_004079 [Penicillium maclennaniae]|uniref:uncharacterized protein n=1 Tax=Penicillium maclennaniae TaxID=1343394 RepID=UPI0025409D70|nr:uncharacterized protein N7477_004079 [Penicillium maclennaniae]KAJ5678446.1 hypothetical protein N7477_004079 [Penicillium maclennaniae]